MRGTREKLEAGEARSTTKLLRQLLWVCHAPEWDQARALALHDDSRVALREHDAGLVDAEHFVPVRALNLERVEPHNCFHDLRRVLHRVGDRLGRLFE